MTEVFTKYVKCIDFGDVDVDIWTDGSVDFSVWKDDTGTVRFSMTVEQLKEIVSSFSNENPLT